MSEATKAGPRIESVAYVELRRRTQEIADLKRERTEFAAALITTLQFLGDMRRGFAQLGGQENRHHWENLDAAISVLQDQITDPSVCLKAHDAAKDAEIRQLKNVVAEAGRRLLNECSGHGIPMSAINVAHFLGYDGDLTFEDLGAFLASVDVEEPVKA